MSISVHYLRFESKNVWTTVKNTYALPGEEGGYMLPTNVEIVQEDFNFFDGKTTKEYVVTVICREVDLPKVFEVYEVFPVNPKNRIAGVNT